MNFELRLKMLYNQKIIIQESENMLNILKSDHIKLQNKIRSLAQDISIKKKKLLDAI